MMDSINEWLLTAWQAETAPVHRYPYISGPTPPLEIGERISIEASLTMQPRAPVVSAEEAMDPENIARGATSAPASELNEEGQLGLQLPGAESWDLYARIDAPDFTVHGREMKVMHLPASGDSQPVRWELTLHEPFTPGVARVRVTLMSEERYVGSLERVFAVKDDDAPEDIADVTHSPASLGSVRAEPLVQPPARALKMSLRARSRADMEVDMFQGLRESDEVTITVRQPGRRPMPARGAVDQSQVRAAIAEKYRVILSAVNRSTQITDDTGDEDLSPEDAIGMMEVLGDKIWRQFTPETVQESICDALSDEEDRLESILIFTDEPAFPWELMRPRCGKGKRAVQYGFLGLELLVGRWHAGFGTSAHQLPPQRLPLETLFVMAPAYTGTDRLARLEEEAERLVSLPRARRIVSDMDGLRAVFGQPQDGVLHFAGHGSLGATDEGAVRYTLRLATRELPLLVWEGWLGRMDDRHPLFFFNTCDLGDSHRIGGFVEGWAPVALDAGAGGFIGGIWPLGDTAAADFSVRFYEEVYRRLESDGRANVADVLRQVRGRFYETGDPTYLAYAFYGDPNTWLVGVGDGE